MNTESAKLDGPRPDEQVFAAKSFVLMQVTLLIVGILVAAIAIDLYWGGQLQAAFKLPASAKEVAWIPGLVGALFIVGSIWEWNSHLQWVALSREGVRWLQSRKVHSRTWDEVVKLQPTEHKEYLNGQLQYTTRGMEVHFQSGKPLIVNDVLFADLDSLTSALERYANGRGPSALSSLGAFRRPAGW